MGVTSALVAASDPLPICVEGNDGGWAQVSLCRLSCPCVKHGCSCHGLENQFWKLHLSEACHAPPRVPEGIFGVYTNPDKRIFKESCGVRLVTLPSVSQLPTSRLEKTSSTSSLGRLSRSFKAENSARNASRNKELGISYFLQICKYINIPVHILYKNTYLYVCTRTYAHIKWIWIRSEASDNSSDTLYKLQAAIFPPGVIW